MEKWTAVNEAIDRISEELLFMLNDINEIEERVIEDKTKYTLIQWAKTQLKWASDIINFLKNLQ